MQRQCSEVGVKKVDPRWDESFGRAWPSCSVGQQDRPFESALYSSQAYPVTCPDSSSSLGTRSLLLQNACSPHYSLDARTDPPSKRAPSLDGSLRVPSSPLLPSPSHLYARLPIRTSHGPLASPLAPSRRLRWLGKRSRSRSRRSTRPAPPSRPSIRARVPSLVCVDDRPLPDPVYRPSR